MSEINKNVPRIAGSDSLEAEGRNSISHDPDAASDDRLGVGDDSIEHTASRYHNGAWLRYAEPHRMSHDELQREQKALELQSQPHSPDRN